MHIISILIACITIQSCAFSIHQHSIGDFGDRQVSTANSVLVDQKDQVIFADFSDFERIDQAYAALAKSVEEEKLLVSQLYMPQI